MSSPLHTPHSLPVRFEDDRAFDIRAVNLGTEELVTIKEVVDMIKDISGKCPSVRFDLTKPQGVRGRNSDNSLLRSILGGWEPRTTLREGLAKTYPWIAEQVARGLAC